MQSNGIEITNYYPTKTLQLQRAEVVPFHIAVAQGHVGILIVAITATEV